MPKTFPIMIEVEEIALGPVLRKLNDMPGIAKLHLQLGHGGEGAGKKQLAHQAAARSNNGSTEQTIVQLPLSGPKHIREIAEAVGGAKSRAYGAMTQLRKQGLAEAGPGKAMHQLTAKARSQLGGGAAGVPALPAPVKHGPSGRASPGSGQIILRAALAAGPVAPSDLRASLGVRGMSEKSIQGVLHRAKRDGLVKQNGAKLYELTAKGMKIELTGAANG